MKGIQGLKIALSVFALVGTIGFTKSALADTTDPPTLGGAVSGIINTLSTLSTLNNTFNPYATTQYPTNYYNPYVNTQYQTSYYNPALNNYPDPATLNNYYLKQRQLADQRIQQERFRLQDEHNRLMALRVEDNRLDNDQWKYKSHKFKGKNSKHWNNGRWQ